MLYIHHHELASIENGWDIEENESELIALIWWIAEWCKKTGADYYLTNRYTGDKVSLIWQMITLLHMDVVNGVSLFIEIQDRSTISYEIAKADINSEALAKIYDVLSANDFHSFRIHARANLKKCANLLEKYLARWAEGSLRVRTDFFSLQWQVLEIEKRLVWIEESHWSEWASLSAGEFNQLKVNVLAVLLYLSNNNILEFRPYHKDYPSDWFCEHYEIHLLKPIVPWVLFEKFRFNKASGVLTYKQTVIRLAEKSNSFMRALFSLQENSGNRHSFSLDEIIEEIEWGDMDLSREKTSAYKKSLRDTRQRVNEIILNCSWVNEFFWIKAQSLFLTHPERVEISNS